MLHRDAISKSQKENQGKTRCSKSFQLLVPGDKKGDGGILIAHSTAYTPQMSLQYHSQSAWWSLGSKGVVKYVNDVKYV